MDQFINMMLREGHEFCGVYGDSPEASKICAEEYGVPAPGGIKDLLSSRIGILGTGDIPSKRVKPLEWAAQNKIHLVSDKTPVIDEPGLKILEEIVLNKTIEIGMMLDFRYSGLVNKLKKEID